MSYNGFYLVGGYPDPHTFFQAAKEGLQYFDFIEVGLPFSDPVADGPALAAASQKALKAGITTASILQCCEELKKHILTNCNSKKIFIMTYANKVFHNGIETNLNNFYRAGVDGIIIADVPYVESQRFAECAKQCNLDYIHFITPESTQEQIREVCSKAKGFVYTVSLRGTTGSSVDFTEEIINTINYAKQCATAPVVVGFGIQSSNDVQKALQLADGFIMGTALVKKLEEGLNCYTTFLKEIF